MHEDTGREQREVSPDREESAWVSLAGRAMPVAVLRAHPERFDRLFARARAEVGHGVCLCRPSRPPRLVIRRRSGRYHLASWPEQGHLHAPRCPWYRTDPALSGRSGYTDAIISTESGTSIRLSAPLRTRTSPAAPPEPGLGPSTSSRHSLGLLALAHYLWEQARLSIWHPGDDRRSWGTCHTRLVQHTSDCSVNGLPARDALFVVPSFHPDVADRNAVAWKAFLARLGESGTSRRRGLVVGQIRQIDPTPYGIRLRLAHLRAPLYASQALYDRARHSYRAAFAAGEDTTAARRVALCLVQRSARGHAVIEDLAVMLTTATWIPVDSSYELRMADALVAAGRSFLKPLRYERNNAVFPDFVLLDSSPESYVEVWGVTGRADYELRKRVKQRYYRAVGHTLIEWDVRDPLPTLALSSAPP